MIHAAVILMFAFGLDVLLGDPPFRFHPVRLVGSSISALEKLLLKVRLSGLLGGIILTVVVLGLFTGGYVLARLFLAALHPWIANVLDLYLAYSCLAVADLVQHAKPVAAALNRHDLPKARAALQKIVGRDTSFLEVAGVARGAVESVAENFVDGVLSPMFWYTTVAGVSHLFGCPSPAAAGVLALISFKIISTLDSMVGYRHDHYLFFGRPAARLDDVANFIPARLSMVILYLGALFSGENKRTGWHIALRDRQKHKSPNAGHAESFVAGALGIKLGGPTVYQEGVVEKPWLGDGYEEVGPTHICRCCRLIYRSSWLSVLIFSTLLFLPSIILG
jgi:adenosylcobinamide-phosphate synthase